MTLLLIGVFMASQLFVIFRLLDKYKLELLPVLVVNYITASACGWVVSALKSSSIVWKTELLWGLWIGALFITMFFIMARSTQRYGMGITTIASKLSLVVPFILGVVVLSEPVNAWNILGLVLAVFSVWAVIYQKKAMNHVKVPILMVLALFAGNGIIDISLKLIETHFLEASDMSTFSAMLFGVAGILGAIASFFRGQISFYRSTGIWKWGIILGTVNFFSIYCFMLSLKSGIPSNVAFIIYNVGIVLLSALIGVVFFKEHKSTLNWIGIVGALVAIALITLVE